MKNFFFLLLVFFESTFHASAQSHFITAGQTQGMIFTDYVPDDQWDSVGPGYGGVFPYYNSTLSLDINRDGINDFTLKAYGDNQNSHSSSDDFSVYPQGQTSILTNLVVSSCYPNPCSGLSVVAKKYRQNDTLVNSIDSLWCGGLVHFAYGNSDPNSSSYTTDNLQPSYAPYYYFVKVIYGVDTLLGYIHLSISGDYSTILDYACEGPTASYIISSVNDLQNDKSITTYPNPFTNQINIIYAKAFDYQITDYLGRVFLSGKTQNNILTIDLPMGNYLLMMKNEEMYSVRKIMKRE